MIIHTVQPADTIFKIARKYSVQPTKIIEDNGLVSDRLIPGQELLILMPTRTVNVRGGDTLNSIARRFGVRKRELLANNPGLFGEEILRPGHILSVKYDVPAGGASSAVGYCGSGVSEHKFKATLPYLTYVIFTAGEIESGGCRVSDDIGKSRLSKKLGKINILGFKDKTEGEFLNASSSIHDSMINLAKQGNFSGIQIDAEAAANKYPLEFAKFLLETRKRLIGCDLILFTECNYQSHLSLTELSDGALYSPYPDSFAGLGADVVSNLERFADCSESEKTFVRLKTLAEGKKQKLTINEALKLAGRSGSEIYFDESTLLCYFDYKHYYRGVGEDIRVSFPSATMTKAKLRKISELGFMGIAFDIESVPVWMLCMFNAYFSRADYSLLVND